MKKRISQDEKDRLWELGEKGIMFEPFQSRIYTHANLFIHVIGQVDYDNYTISGIEKCFDKQLKDEKLKYKPFKLAELKYSTFDCQNLEPINTFDTWVAPHC